MRRLFNAAFLYTILGLAGGLFYRELTHINRFTGDTQLAVVHTHFLVLGMAFFLIVMLLERAFTLSESKLFNWFFWIYNAGLIWTVGFQTFNGSMTVLGTPNSSAIAGMSGLGHILLTVALILLFIGLRSRVLAPAQEPAQTPRPARQVADAQI